MEEIKEAEIIIPEIEVQEPVSPKKKVKSKEKKYKIKLNFDKIKAWRDVENDDLPVRGMISFYKASGVFDMVTKHRDEIKGKVAPIDNFSCNFYTQKRIKEFIKERWEVFSMTLKDNNEVIWNTHTFTKGTEHYNRSLSKRVSRSLAIDFLNYCPKIDEELEDNIIVFTVFPPVDDIITTESKESKNKNN